MQDEDTANPGMLRVLDGEGLWKRELGAASTACADCHGEARASMKGVAARYPAFDKATGRPIDLEQRIDSCAPQHPAGGIAALREPRIAARSRPSGARQSPGVPIETSAPTRDSPRSSKRGASATCSGRDSSIFGCANCHDDNWDKRLAGSAPITQGHPTGYPLCRLEWRYAAGSSCSGGCAPASPASARRPMDYGTPELVELELLPDVAGARDGDGGAGGAALQGCAKLRQDRVRAQRNPSSAAAGAVDGLRCALPHPAFIAIYSTLTAPRTPSRRRTAPGSPWLPSTEAAMPSSSCSRVAAAAPGCRRVTSSAVLARGQDRG